MPEGWPQVRRARLDIDRHRCVECGRVCPHNDPTIAAAGHHAVDHIVPRRWEHNPARALELSNLRTLCAACHRKLGAGTRF